MTAPIDTPTGDLAAILTEALTAGTRGAFTALLTEDVQWGGEHPGSNECVNRDQAGDHYAGLLAAGVQLTIGDLEQTDPTSADVFTLHMRVRSPDPDDYPSVMPIRLTLRDGLIAEICHLDRPPTIEVVYFDDCPHHETFLPHLKTLLAAHGITTPVTLTRIDTDEDAQVHQFLGSPTVRIDGHDVDPTVADRELRDTQDAISSSPYGLQCRLYRTPDGTTGAPQDQWILDALMDNPSHEAAIAAIHTGNLATLRQLLNQHPDLATIRLPRHGGRTLLHIATDWPGHYPNVAATIATLVAAGADPDTGGLGEHPETPLHWAASSGDIAAIDALLDAGANINAPGAVIGGGTPMADTTAFGEWEAARHLLGRGADTNLFEAAALGLVAQVEHHLNANQPTAEDITSSFWGACHGGHVATATVLLDHGANINWVGYDGLTPLDAANRSEATTVTQWLEQRGGSSASKPPEPPAPDRAHPDNV